jgi:hypothetical protein
MARGARYDTEFSLEVARRLKFLRKNSKLTVAQFLSKAHCIGFTAVNGPWIYHVEYAPPTESCRAPRSVTVDDVNIYAQVLGIKLADILDDFCSTCGNAPPPRFTCQQCGRAA